MWRCANDMFLYCKGDPSWEKEPRISKHGDSHEGICNLSPESCGKTMTNSEVTKVGNRAKRKKKGESAG